MSATTTANGKGKVANRVAKVLTSNPVFSELYTYGRDKGTAHKLPVRKETELGEVTARLANFPDSAGTGDLAAAAQKAAVNATYPEIGENEDGLTVGKAQCKFEGVRASNFILLMAGRKDEMDTNDAPESEQ